MALNEEETPVTDQAMDEALNPDFFSGSQLKALKKMDDKNVDYDKLVDVMSTFLEKYTEAKK